MLTINHLKLTKFGQILHNLLLNFKLITDKQIEVDCDVLRNLLQVDKSVANLIETQKATKLKLDTIDIMDTFEKAPEITFESEKEWEEKYPTITMPIWVRIKNAVNTYDRFYYNPKVSEKPKRNGHRQHGHIRRLKQSTLDKVK